MLMMIVIEIMRPSMIVLIVMFVVEIMSPSMIMLTMMLIEIMGPFVATDYTAVMGRIMMGRIMMMCVVFTKMMCSPMRYDPASHVTMMSKFTPSMIMMPCMSIPRLGCGGWWTKSRKKMWFDYSHFLLNMFLFGLFFFLHFSSRSN